MNNLDRFKFRIWDKEAEEAICANVAIDSDGDPFMYYDEYGAIALQYMDKEKVIIEQCTGLRDSEGTLIYEGDIVLVGLANFKISFDCGSYFLKSANTVIYFNRLSMPTINKLEMKVVGNIHENKELLEGQG